MVVMKKTAVLVLAVTLFGATVLRPRVAGALDAWAWAGIGVASYAAFIFTMTLVIFGGSPAPLVEPRQPLLEEENESGTVRFGTNCRSTEGMVPVVCW